MKYLLICLVLLSGCAMPETARATKQADQAVEGIGMLVDEITPIVSSIKDDDQRAKIRAVLEHILELVQSARMSISPSLAYLGDARVDTSAKEAATKTKVFVAKAAIQAGRASAEVESTLAWSDMLGSFFDPSTLEGWLVGISTLLTGSGALGLVIAKTIRYKAALQDQIAYTRERQAIPADDVKAIDELQKKHAQRQKIRGTKAIIDNNLQKVKDGTHT